MVATYLSRQRCSSTTCFVKSRPLPDERPRQSVANLIGRFETQTKRLSLSASSPSRSSSVVSHITGDSAKEDVKEKREWPPKTAPTPEKAPLILPSLSFRNAAPAPIAQSSSNGSELGLNSNRKLKDTAESTTEDLEVPLTAKALNASQRQSTGEPNSFLENWRKDLPSSQVDLELEDAPPTATPQGQIQPGIATPTPSSAQKLSASSGPRTPNSKVASKASVAKQPTTKTAATKVPPSSAAKAIAASSKTPLKTPAKPPTPKEPVTPSLAPLKPQHTGQSVSSASGARRLVAKPSGTAPKTPSRPEATSRSKTPTSARPKTPSSGLFAPTAASLARSRNAAPPLPTPVKKSTLSSSSLDRLSKPTAASKAKINTVTPPPPSRPGGTSTSRPSAAAAAKAKATASPLKAKKDSAEPSSVSGASVGTPVVSDSLTDAPTEESQEPQQVDEQVESVPHGDSHEVLEDTTDVVDTSKHGEEVLRSEGEVKQDSQTVGSSPISPAPAPQAEHSDVPSPVIEDDMPLSASTHPEVKDNLEDIVNLLESVSVKEPIHEHAINAVDIPDEILEIPTEEDK